MLLPPLPATSLPRAADRQSGRGAGRLGLVRGVVGIRPGQPALSSRAALVVLNLVGVALVAAVWAHGWLDGMIATDVYAKTKLNVGVFLVGLTLCGHRIVKLSQDLNEIKDNAYNPASRANVYRRATAGKDSPTALSSRKR